MVSLNDTSAALCCLRRLLSTMTSKTVNYDALNIFIELCIDEKCFREGITMSLKLSGENPPFHIVANTIAALIHCGDLVDAEVFFFLFLILFFSFFLSLFFLFLFLF